jgi:acyl-CoA oxidase
MLRTLVAGRVSIAAAAVSAAKSGLTIAVRFAAERKQFGPRDGDEEPILNYLAVQRTLAPRIAKTFGLHFAVRDLQRRFGAAQTEEDGELEALAAGLKAYASDHCVDTLGACRRTCGGQGYLAANGFAALKADTEIFTTFEGANLVLYQLAAKGLLSRYQSEMSGLDLRGALRYLGERAETSLTELNPLTTRKTDPSHLMDPAFHAAALAYRRDRLLRSVATRMRARLREGMDSFAAVNEVQDHLIDLAKAHVESLILTHFAEAVAAEPGTEVSGVLGSLAALFALSAIEADRGWFLEAGYIDPPKSRAIRSQVSALCAEISHAGVELVDGFGIPEPLLPEFVRQDGDGESLAR